MEKSLTPELCLRTITVRAAEQFKITRDEFETSLHGQWTTIQNLIASFSSAIMNFEYLDNLEGDISKAYGQLCTTSASYMSFLTKTRSRDSIKYYKEHSEAISTCKKTVDTMIKKRDSARQKALEVASRRSKGSEHSHVSNQTSFISRKRAKDEAAKVKLTFAEHETAIKKEHVKKQN